MAATLHNGIVPGAEAKKLYSYPTLSGSTDQFLTGKGTWANPYTYATFTDVVARVASLESILSTTCTASVDASGCLVYKLSNNKVLLKIDKAGEW